MDRGKTRQYNGVEPWLAAIRPTNRMPSVMPRMRSCLVLGAVLGLVALPQLGAAQGQQTLAQKFATSLTTLPSEPLGVSGSFYVPVYSSVSLNEGRLRADFSVTMNIHNASENQPLVIRRIAYFDTAGKLVESYLKEPVALKPFATVDVFIPINDTRGGTGANFVVDWAAAGEIAEPVIEALMIGSVASGHYAIVSQGRPVKLVGGK
jgi:hypothetical protein